MRKRTPHHLPGPHASYFRAVRELGDAADMLSGAVGEFLGNAKEIRKDLEKAAPELVRRFDAVVNSTVAGMVENLDFPRPEL